MDSEQAMAWVDAYEQAWRAGDPEAAERLFTPDIAYRRSPYEPALDLAGLQKFWTADEGESFTVTAEPVAVEGSRAVIWLEVRYGEPVRQEYRDLWLLRFAADGRVEDFEEWAYWPGRGYTIESEE